MVRLTKRVVILKSLGAKAKSIRWSVGTFDSWTKSTIEVAIAIYINSLYYIVSCLKNFMLYF